MDTYWVPGVNHLGTFGRWAFAELTQMYDIETDLGERMKGAFGQMVAPFVGSNQTPGRG
jgi:type III restriction enzyme